MTKWLSASDRVRLASQLVAAMEDQFTSGQYLSVLGQFGVETERAPGYLFHILIHDADDDSIAELGEHFDLEVPDKPSQHASDSDPSEIDAYAELVSAETALRDVIRTAVPNWQADFSADDIKQLADKRTEEDRRRDGIAVSADLLDYTEIYQLQEIINKHWDDGAKAVFDDKKRTDVYLSIILDIRNAIGHSRPIFGSERLLLAGAASQIRNQLAQHRAKADGPEAHYPSIDSARDSGGRDGVSSPSLLSVPTNELKNLPRLDVGNTITFDLEATDPRGRELWWRACSIPYKTSPSSFNDFPEIGDAQGGRGNITWTVGDGDVGEYRQFVIALASTGKFHRHGEWDDGVLFHYHVNPPPEA